MRDVNELLERESLVLRMVWMLAFTLAWQVAEILLAMVVIGQLCCRIFQGAPNPALLEFGDSLSQYLAQIGRFGSFNSEEKPWPFADWPAPQPPAAPEAAARTPGP
ncbi:DUF4389 domain-containing protein [Pseudomonas sp. N040]|uniref:DUF4389 domain-containing protein n=1 Tax=Pseudomonas sp. N040 TaxID=2785325 RepID=UPI0018A25785|nr:DUF4389 domain-containing protein [Pseudomonas sp. N040]MBF7729479.1 DUF4389 domain-containing protein [Pseudomonas sp. N040]MBW7013119.1 DUF4389 domain-containing protein [Pseudomonas sp. N040]